MTALVVGVGRFGFNPTDQGYVLAQTWQLKHGAVPHLEAISSRPFGSEILHQIDFWLPGPLYLSSMWLSTLELVAATVWLAALVLDRPVRTWGATCWSAVTAAVLLNVHTFPLMAWPTIDGVALVAGGLLAVSRGVRRESGLLCCVGALACGLAPLTKQSFAAAPVIALLLLRSQRAGRWRSWVCLLAPGLGYVGWVTLAGGFGAMTDQLLGGHAVYGRNLVDDPVRLVQNQPMLAILSALILAVLAALVRTRAEHMLRVEVGLFLLLLGAIVIDSRLVAGGSWGDLLFWATAGIMLVRMLREGRVVGKTGTPLVLVVAWMVSLSWGYTNPDLVSGSLLLTAAVEAWRVLGAPVLTRPRSMVALGLAGVLATGGVVFDARQTTYYDGPRSGLTEDAGSFAAGLRGIRTSEATAAYLREIKECVRDHPADHVAVLPDNPVIYPLLDLQDPFPQIWVLPAETYGNVPQQLVDAARRLNEQGSFLVLFQTYSAFDIETAGPVVPPEELFIPGLQHALVGQLRGEVVVCGSLIGVYRPSTQ